MKKQLLKKLSICLPLGVAFVIMVMFSAGVNAQIIYTDIIPDTTINKNGGVYNLDLNNDKITDFRITFNTATATYGKCGSANKINILITPLDSNAVGNTSTYPSALNLNSVIDSSSFVWRKNSNQILANVDWSCVGSGRYPFVRYNLRSTITGNWNGKNDKYLPLQLNLKSQKYYGWVRLDVASVAASFTVKDYAYDSTSNQSVIAGCSTPTVSLFASGPVLVCSGDSVKFISTTNFPSKYQWFKDENPIPSANSSSYSAFSAGAYYVNVSNSCGLANSTIDTVSVFAVDTSVTVRGDTLTANAAGATYQWINCSTMQQVIGANAQTFLPPQYGIFAVIVTENGCSRTSSCYISCSPPTISLTSSGPLSICSGDSVKFNVTDDFSYSYEWFKDGNPISGANSSSYSTSSAGKYYVNVRKGCSIASSKVETLSVFAVDTSVKVSGDTLIANAARAAYQWIDCSTMQIISGATSQTFLPSKPGSFAVIVTENGCSRASSCYISCFPLTVTLTSSGPLSICSGESVQFNAITNFPSNYQWFKDGNAISGAISSSYTAFSKGAYYVNVSKACGKVNSTVNTVSVFTVDTSVTLKGNGFTANAANATYQWINCATKQRIPGATAQTFLPTQNGSFAVIVTDNGCSNTSSCYTKCISVDASVTVSGKILTANAASATYQWIDCSTMKIIPGANAQTFSPTQNGSFAVIVTQNSCSDTSTCNAIIITGIRDNIFASSIVLYPNPASNQLTIDLGSTKQKAEVTITDITGKVMYSIIASETQKINVSTQDFNAGIYLVQIQASDFTITKKLVVEK
jgi:ureidoglycolate hydrolase